MDARHHPARRTSLALWTATLALCLTSVSGAGCDRQLGKGKVTSDSTVRMPDARDDAGRATASDGGSMLADAGTLEPALPDAGAMAPSVDAATSNPDPNALDPTLRDVTFFVTSDTHIGRPDEDTDATKASMAMIAAMHAVEGAAFPDGQDLGMVGKPRGVVITGDLTDDNRSEQWTTFDSIWGVNGEGAVRYPVFEGWGNHDLHGDRPDTRQGVLARHARRKQTVHVAEGEGAHYSWDFHDVHLVHLNLYPGMEGGLGLDSPGLYNPRQSLAFLADDLATRVAKTGRPVVVFFHFTLEEGDRGWAASERNAFFKALEPYNVLGVFVGHAHAQKFAQVQSLASSSNGHKIDMYMADDTLSAASGRKTGFYVVHIGPTQMVVAERTLNGPTPWGFVRTTPIVTP